ncbi:MAG: carboxymuconolactone decarboxylase family protein [Alphaproteobacteria bacterium]
MSSPRIAPLDPPYAPETQADFDRVMKGAPPIALFRTIARDRRLLQRFFGGGLLDRGNLTITERETMILRTTARHGCVYEWGVHVRIFADAAHLTHAQVSALTHGATHAVTHDPTLTDDQHLIVRLADALYDASRVDDALWAELAARWDDAALLELLMLAGFYAKVSYVANALRLPPEPGTPDFNDVAPDGTTTGTAAR